MVWDCSKGVYMPSGPALSFYTGDPTALYPHPDSHTFEHMEVVGMDIVTD